MTRESDPLAGAVTRACAGDAAAVEELVTAVEDQIYGLAIRMLWHPEDARDATQDILVRIVTHLSSYRGESRFSTWCYAIAANHLRTVRRSRVEEAGYTFESFEAELHEPSLENEDVREHPDYQLAVEEVRVGCTLGMLACLNRDQRLAYILGEILELDHTEAASILDIAPATFRQRLSRARAAIFAFTTRACGIVDPKNACRCEKRVAFAVNSGRVSLGAPLFAELKAEVRRLDEMRNAVALYRSHPTFRAPAEVRAFVTRLVGTAGVVRR